MNRTRDQIVAESANAVASCWNHYVDCRLTDDEKEKVREALDELLPKEISIEDWKKYANECERRHEEEG